MTGQPPLLEVSGLCKDFALPGGLFSPARVLHAVRDVGFVIQAGESLGLVGESGSGKSTVARCITQLERPTAGSVRFAGHELTRMSNAALRPIRRDLQIVFQDPYAALDPRMTAGRFVAEPIALQEPRLGRAAISERVAELFRTVGLDPDGVSRYPFEFSGGQRQRICIARALAMNPKLIVADEPITALDVSIQAQIVNLFQEIQERRGIAFLFVSHDLAMVRHLCHRVAVMLRGCLVETAPADRLFADPRHPYTRALIAAMLEPDPQRARGRRHAGFDSDGFDPARQGPLTEVAPGHCVRLPAV